MILLRHYLLDECFLYIGRAGLFITWLAGFAPCVLQLQDRRFGDELLELRACLANSQGAQALARDAYLHCLASAFKQGGPSEQSLTLMDAPSQALLGALEQPSIPAHANRRGERKYV